MLYKDRVLRHELKFPATAAQCEILRQRFSAVLMHDNNGDNGRYRVTSLYFDDVYNSAYNDKLCGIDVRKKYRIRTYNLNPERIHLECKYKDRDMVSKTGLWLYKEQYDSILAGDISFMWEKRLAGSVAEEFAISNAAAGLSPSVIVDYNREAFIKPEGNVRITIDSGFKLGAFSKDMYSDITRYLPVYEPAAVIEVKYDDYAPSYIFDLLGGIKLTQQSASKFLICKEKQLSMHLY